MIAPDDSSSATLSDEQIDDILYAARANDQEDLTSLLLSTAKESGSTEQAVLFAAVAPDSKNTAFHYAAANGHDTLITYITTLSGNDSSYVNRQNAAGNTPLHWAALNGHLSATKALIKAGANMWVRNGVGNLAVFEAERAEKDDVVAYLLIEGGTEKEKEHQGEGQDTSDGEEMEEVRVSIGEVGLDGKEP